MEMLQTLFVAKRLHYTMSIFAIFFSSVSFEI